MLLNGATVDCLDDNINVWWALRLVLIIQEEVIGKLIKFIKEKHDIPLIQLVGCSLLCTFAHGNNDNRLYIAIEGIRSEFAMQGLYRHRDHRRSEYGTTSEKYHHR